MKTIILFASILASTLIAQAEVLNLKAVYTVPVQEDVLRELATYEVPRYRVENSDDGSAKMAFNLPENLVGKKNLKIVLQLTSQEDQIKFFSGPKGDASCVGPWKKMTCEFQFRNLNIEKEKLKNFLDKKFQDKEVATKLFRIGSGFGDDPIGFIHIQE